MLLHAYRNEFGRFDWFAKVDPDTVFVAPNFRRLVLQLRFADVDHGHYVGHALRSSDGSNASLNAGCSYALSSDGLRLLGPVLAKMPPVFPAKVMVGN